MKKYLLTFLTVWIIGLCIGLVGGSIASLKKDQNSKSVQSKWNGGKPRPPIEVSISQVSPVAPDSEIDVAVSVTPLTTCSQIKIQIRGLHGIIALEPTQGVLSPCTQDAPVLFTARIRVPAETAGAIVADVELDSEEGKYSYSQSAQISASNATSTYSLSMGNLKTSPRGEVVREMKADENIN